MLDPISLGVGAAAVIGYGMVTDKKKPATRKKKVASVKKKAAPKKKKATTVKKKAAPKKKTATRKKCK